MTIYSGDKLGCGLLAAENAEAPPLRAFLPSSGLRERLARDASQ